MSGAWAAMMGLMGSDGKQSRLREPSERALHVAVSVVDQRDIEVKGSIQRAKLRHDRRVALVGVAHGEQGSAAEVVASFEEERDLRRLLSGLGVVRP